MSFANPLLLLGLLGAGLPVLIHLIYRRRPQKQAFPAIELLLRSARRVERSLRVRRWVLLASRVLLLAAFAFAAARPMDHSAAEAVGSTVGPEDLALVIDGSMSMRARFGDRTVFGRALERARALVADLGPDSRMSLVVAEQSPRALVDVPTADRGRLLGVLRELEPGYGPSSLAEAIGEAVLTLDAPVEGGDGERRRRVVVLSDLARPAVDGAALLETSSGTEVALEVVDVAQEVPASARVNSGIVEASPAVVPDAGPRTVEVAARIQSFAAGVDAASRPRDLELWCDDEPEPRVRSFVDIIPGTLATREVPVTFDSTGVHACDLRLQPDSLREDDEYPVRIELQKQVRTLVVDGAPSGVAKEDETYYLERAMAAGIADHPSPQIITADELPRANFDELEVVVLAGVTQLRPSDGERLRAFVESGGGLFLTAAEDYDYPGMERALGAVLPGRLGPPKRRRSGHPASLAEPRLEHPILNVFDAETAAGLLTARTEAALVFEPNRPSGWTQVLSYEDGGAALVVAASGRGRVAILTTTIDREWTDLPIRPGFVPLVRRTILWLGAELEATRQASFLVGRPARLRVGPEVVALEVDGPGPNPTVVERAAVDGAEVEIRGLDRPGHHRVRTRVRGGRWEDRPDLGFIVIPDPIESDIRPVPAAEAVAVLRGEAAPTEVGGEVRSRNRRRFGVQELTGWLLLAMLGFLLAESLVTAVRSGR